MHINSISCGQGAPSLFMIILAGEKHFPADVVIVADTGWENDCLWNTGERTSAYVFFENVTKPLANKYGIDAVMVRTVDENGNHYDSIPDSIMKKQLIAGTSKPISDDVWSDSYGLDIPLFGSKGGRLKQSCTSKWKIQAIRQELRRRGAKTATTALGLHRTEAHRIKPSDNKWSLQCWPLCDLAETPGGGVVSMNIGRTWDRTSIQSEMERRGIPYLVTTECDGCPHKDWERWKRTSPAMIEQLTSFEATFNGNFFLTNCRKPLNEAILLMEKKHDMSAGLFDTCDSGYCFV